VVTDLFSTDLGIWHSFGISGWRFEPQPPPPRYATALFIRREIQFLTFKNETQITPSVGRCLDSLLVSGVSEELGISIFRVSVKDSVQKKTSAKNISTEPQKLKRRKKKLHYEDSNELYGLSKFYR
jgi:hypothetical protein